MAKPDSWPPVGLILIPGLLVCFGVALVIWLTVGSADVEGLVQKLRQEDRQRWRAAATLASVLSKPGNASLTGDIRLAGQLSQILSDENGRKSPDEESLMLRMYLCRALGEFRVPGPLPVLLRTATAGNGPQEIPVRRAALEGIALLVHHLGAERLRSDERLLEALERTSHDEEPVVRSASAYALGVLGGAPAERRLETLLADRDADTRYNAATGLARQGNAAAVPVLLEMLEPATGRGDERATIRRNALQASRMLLKANPDAPPLAELRAAME